MSHLVQEEEFQEFAGELENEVSSSLAVFETFEINSSLMSTYTDVGTAVTTVDDSSSSDAVKLVDVSDNGSLMPLPISTSANELFNPNKVYVISNEDDADEREDDTEQEQAKLRQIATADGSGDEKDNELDTSNKNCTLIMEIDAAIQVNGVENVSQITLSSRSSLADNNEEESAQVEVKSSNELIVQKNAAPIFLETPVIEEQQLHHNDQHFNNESRPAHHSHYHHQHLPYQPQHLPHIPSAICKPHMQCNSAYSKDSDGVVAGADCHPQSNQHRYQLQCSFNEYPNDIAAKDAAAVNSHCQQQPPPSILFGEASQQAANESVPPPNNETMICRLHEMHININCMHHQPPKQKQQHIEHNNAQVAEEVVDQQDYAIIDIETMDLLERRDFETEQRLTGGIILKNSSNKNTLNLKIIENCITKQSSQQQYVQENSNKSQISKRKSVRKCLSTDNPNLQKTPISSRNGNQHATKSNLKLKQRNYMNKNFSIDEQTLPTEETDEVQEQHASDNENDKKNSESKDKRTFETENDGPTTSLAALAEAAAAAVAAAVAATNAQSHGSNKIHFVRRSTRQYKISTSNHLGEGDCSRTTAVKTIPTENLQDVHPWASSSAAAVSSAVETKYRSRSSSSCMNSSNESSTDQNKDTGLAGAYKSMLSEMQCDLQQQVVENAEFDDHTWSAGSEEDASSSILEMEEKCTCDGRSSHSGNIISLNEQDVHGVLLTNNLNSRTQSNIGKIQVATGRLFDVTRTCNSNKKENSSNYTDLSNYISMDSIAKGLPTQFNSMGQQRKRKHAESRLVDEVGPSCTNKSNHATKGHINLGSFPDNLSQQTVSNNNNSTSTNDVNSHKRIAYDVASTPQTTQTLKTSLKVSIPTSTELTKAVTPCSSTSLHGRHTTRSIIPTRDNPPPELHGWLVQFQKWTHVERLMAVDRLIAHCEPTQVRHMMKVIEPQFQRDFISLLPRELALQVLSYLEPKDLLRAAQTCRSWRFLCDDNLLWKEKCRKAQLLIVGRDKPKRGRTGNMPPISSLWKAAYMRQHIIELNWRSRPIRQPKVLKGHDDHVITCLQFHGNRIVSGSDDNTLKVWSAVTGRCLRTLVGHTGGVWSSQMSGNIIVSGSTDRTLKVWDMDTGQCVHTLMGHTSTVRCMHLHGHKVVSGSRDATLRVWDIKQGICLHVLLGHLAAVRCVQYDGKLIVSGAYDYMVKIWHPERQECLHTLQGHTNRVYSLQFDGVHVVSGSLDTSIRVWDVDTGSCKHTLMGHQSLTSGMELRQNILVSGNADSTVKVWDITTGQCLQTLSGPNKHQSAVTCLQFNARFVVTSSDDGTVKLWDVNTGEFIRNLVALESGGSGGVVWRIRANDTKLICAVGSRNGTEETKLMVLDFDVEGACVKCS